MGSIPQRLIVACLVAAMTGLLMPAILGGKDDMWGRFVYDYQTLIAGILAVFAAAVAVYQSARAERRQEKRHREQMFLSQRKDLFAVRRLCKELEQRLGYFGEAIRVFVQHYPTTAQVWTRDAKVAYLSVLRSGSNLFDRLNAIGDLERSLFDPPLEETLAAYRRLLEELMGNFPERAKGFQDVYPNSDHAPAAFNRTIGATCARLEAETRDLLSEFLRWRREIESVYQG